MNLNMYTHSLLHRGVLYETVNRLKVCILCNLEMMYMHVYLHVR
jgi:hypothetical protein